MVCGLDLAQGSADLIQGLGPQRGAWTLYKAELYNNIQYSGEPSARRPWVGRTDAEQEENWERNWESDKKRLTRVKALTLPSTILYFCHPVFQPSCISALLLHNALNSDKLQRLD